MFVIEGMDKVRDIIEKNRKRKLAKHKSCQIIPSSKLTIVLRWKILKLQKNLLQIAEQESDHVCLWKRERENPEIQQLI